MRLIGKMQSLSEAICEYWLQAPYAGLVEVLVSMRHACKPHEFGFVALCCDDQGAADKQGRLELLPQLKAAQSQLADDRMRRLGFAIWRKHRAGNATGGAAIFLFRCFAQRHLMAA